MRIAVLDGYTLNPGDLSWEAFERLGDFVVYDRTSAAELPARAEKAEILLTNKTVLSRELIARLPNLIYIGVLATGYNVVDVKAAAERGVPVTNVPEYGTPAVVQLTFAHLLNLCHRVAEHGVAVRNGAWTQSEDFCFWKYPLVELSQKTMGIVGLGRIGTAVAAVAAAFGMDVVACDPTKKSSNATNISFADMRTVFQTSDVVSLHCPLTESNRGFVNKELLGLMKKNAFLINTGRGPLIDEIALAEALNCGSIAGAGLDVLTEEPPRSGSPLLSARNCYVTPHIAWATLESRRRLMKKAAENLESFLLGKKINTVN